jgi:hypothetical protein
MAPASRWPRSCGPGNAAANTATDQIDVVDLALAQLPNQARERQPILVRADAAGATHGLVDHLQALGVGFSVGFDLDSRVRTAILALPADAWVAAIDADGGDRDGAQVAELATLDLPVAGWPPGTRAICRRERPHPGAQLTFTDADGWRFQVFITDQPDPTSRSWSCATASTPGWRIASAVPRPPAPATCHPTGGGATPSGSSWCCSPWTWSAGRKPCCWTAS